jgi:hypothetical protein
VVEPEGPAKNALLGTISHWKTNLTKLESDALLTILIYVKNIKR